MLALIKSKLSLKVSIALALVTLPPMVLAALLVSSREAANLERLTLASAKVAATNGAKVYAAMLEAGVDTGAFTLADLFEPAYEEIKGFDFGDSPRFHTRYDHYTDRALLGIEDQILESHPDFLFALGVDVNGYGPTHNTKFSAPLTGDRAKDLSGNRTKRKFSDPVGLRAAKNTEPLLQQEYRRDTGEVAWDVSAPIYVKGRHFGGFRVGVSIASLSAHVRSLVLQLATVFAVLIVLIVGFIFVMLRRSMKPLEHLSELAIQISTGENLAEPIKPSSTDEIGQMAKSMNRLRASLQAAMSRLGE